MADISKITLPSGNTYDIKDAVAREAIAGGVTFIIAWDGASTPVIADIPAGVTVTYEGTSYTGTLSAETTGTGTHAQAGAFYLVKSSSTPSGQTLDIFDEYVPVGTTGSKYWEKLGDTQIDLSDVVTGVTLNKQTATTSTDTAIGSDATFTITQPTITLTEGTTGVTFVRDGTTKYMKATATGGGASWNSKDQKTVVTGYSSPTTDTFVKSVSAETNKNLVTTTITGVNGTESVSKVTKTASKLVTTSIPNITSAGSASTWTFEEKTIPNVTSAGSASTWAFEEKSIPNVTAVGSASTWSFAMGTGDAAETLIISGVNSTTPTLGTAIKVQSKSSGSNGSAPTLGTAIKVQSKSGGGNGTAPTLGTAITAATGSVDATGTGSDIITAVTISDKTVAKAASAATTVATGETSTTGTGAAVVTGVTVGESAAAITGLGTASTATVIGSSSTFTNTQPTITLSNDGVSGTDVKYIESLDTSKKMSGSASGANTAWNNKDTVTAVTGITSGTKVLTDGTTLTITKGNA